MENSHDFMLSEGAHSVPAATDNFLITLEENSLGQDIYKKENFLLSFPQSSSVQQNETESYELPFEQIHDFKDIDNKDMQHKKITSGPVQDIKNNFLMVSIKEVQGSKNTESYQLPLEANHYITDVNDKDIKPNQDSDRAASSYKLCPVCKKDVSKANFARHTKNVHQIVKLLCLQCGIQCNSLPILSKHMEKVHTIEEKAKCEFCSKQFDNEKMLDLHKTKSHSSLDIMKTTRVECEIYKKLLKSKRNLAKHVRNTHKNI